MTRLKKLLESNDGEAADFIVEAESQLIGVLTGAEMKTLADQVGNFEFESALECLSSITSRLSIDLDGRS